GRPAADPVILRTTSAPGGTGPAGARRRTRLARRNGGRAAHRGRGLRGSARPRVARLPRPYAAQRGDVRPRWLRLRLLLLRHALVHEPGLRCRGRSLRRAAAGGGGRDGPRARTAAAYDGPRAT